MPGFFGIITEQIFNTITNLEIPCGFSTPLVCDERKGPEYYFKRHVIPKFLDDKVFEENAAVFIGTDGILFNSLFLMKKYGIGTNFALIEKIYSEQGIEGISELRGNFSGFILDKKSGVLHIFTDHVGTKNIFWFFDEKKKIFVFGSELKIVVAVMRKLGYTPGLSETGAYCLLTFGFMIGDNTLVSEIKKIPPGSILTYSNEQVKIDQYYKLPGTPEIADSEKGMIKKLDLLFSEAIKLEYEKDLEYHYSHVATLSGGLDSRMNVMNAKKLGYSDILCLCFSQSNYFDQIIAQKIASDHGFDFIFHALDNGNYLKNIDEAVHANDGLTVYAGSAHMQSSLKLLDWTKCGLLHTGLLWFGSFQYNTLLPMNIDSVKKLCYSTKLLDEHFIQRLNILQKYENFELLALYEYGFNGSFNGYRIIEQFDEFSSPLHNKDFLEYAIRIPQRNNLSILIKWIMSEVPDAAEYRWERTGVRIDAGLGIKLLYRVYRFFRAKLLGKNNINSMYPFQYWYNTNPGLKEFIHTYFTMHIGLLKKHPHLMNDAQRLFDEGTCLEKTQVLTLLAAMKLHSLCD